MYLSLLKTFYAPVAVKLIVVCPPVGAALPSDVLKAFTLTLVLLIAVAIRVITFVLGEFSKGVKDTAGVSKKLAPEMSIAVVVLS